MTRPKRARAERLSRVLQTRPGFYRAAELRRQGISSRDLHQLVALSTLERLGRGLYRVSTIEITAFDSLAEVVQRVPRGVICLSSALAYHGLTTLVPPEVTVALPRGAWRPVCDYPPVRYFAFSAAMYALGQTVIEVAGMPVPIYDREKTVCDTLRFRQRLGMALALEGLKTYLHQPGRNLDRLFEYAAICRVEKLVRCYGEALLA